MAVYGDAVAQSGFSINQSGDKNADMIIRDNLRKMDIKPGSAVRIFVSCGALSKAIGQKKRNKLRLTQEFSISDIKFYEKEEISEYSCMVEQSEFHHLIKAKS